MIWDDDKNIEMLVGLWGDGLSASQVASQLSVATGTTVSRSAVIGKVHRLRLAGRATATRNVTRVYRKPKKGKPKPVASNLPGSAPKKRISAATAALAALDGAKPDLYVAAAYEELVIPLAERKTIATLEDTDCRWPIGDPQHDEFHFCGKGKVGGLPYCVHHARRAFRPVVATGANLARRPLQIVSGSLGSQEPQLAAGGTSEREKEDA